MSRIASWIYERLSLSGAPNGGSVFVKLTLSGLLIGLLYSFGVVCAAEDGCRFESGFVTEPLTQNMESVAESTWLSSVDINTGETIKRLTVTYQNGDIAVVTHRYCEMYNFELNYFVAGSESLDPDSIARVIVNHYNAYAKLTAEFEEGLDQVIVRALEAEGLSEAFSVGLPEGAIIESPGVEYSMGYQPLGEVSGEYGAAINFYWGVGGL